MKKLIFLILTTLYAWCGYAQTTGYIRNDTVKITNNTKSATLVLETASKGHGWYLKDVGNGRLQFVQAEIADINHLQDSLNTRLKLSGGQASGPIGAVGGFYVPGTNGFGVDVGSATTHSFMSKDGYKVITPTGFTVLEKNRLNFSDNGTSHTQYLQGSTELIGNVVNTLPRVSGRIAIEGDPGAGFIQAQDTTVQSGGQFWIAGNGRLNDLRVDGNVNFDGSGTNFITGHSFQIDAISYNSGTLNVGYGKKLRIASDDNSTGHYFLETDGTLSLVNNTSSNYIDFTDDANIVDKAGNYFLKGPTNYTPANDANVIHNSGVNTLTDATTIKTVQKGFKVYGNLQLIGSNETGEDPLTINTNGHNTGIIINSDSGSEQLRVGVNNGAWGINSISGGAINFPSAEGVNILGGTSSYGGPVTIRGNIGLVGYSDYLPTYVKYADFKIVNITGAGTPEAIATTLNSFYGQTQLDTAPTAPTDLVRLTDLGSYAADTNVLHNSSTPEAKNGTLFLIGSAHPGDTSYSTEINGNIVSLSNGGAGVTGNTAGVLYLKYNSYLNFSQNGTPTISINGYNIQRLNDHKLALFQGDILSDLGYTPANEVNVVHINGTGIEQINQDKQYNSSGYWKDLSSSIIGDGTTITGSHINLQNGFGSGILALNALSATFSVNNGTQTTRLGYEVGSSFNIVRDDGSTPIWSNGGTFTGDITLANANGSNPLSPVAKITFDNALTGISWKNSVRVKTTTNITLSGTQTIDGVAVVAGNRILVNNQTDPKQNGIYVVGTGAWSRATDADSGDEISTATVAVMLGTVNKNTQWTNIDPYVPVIGTDNIDFGQISGAGTYAGSNGVDLNGNLFTLNSTYARGLFSTTGALTYNSATGSFGIPIASGSQAGALSMTDWNAFNSKQAAISMSSGQIAYSNGSTLIGSSNFFWDASTNRLGLLTNAPNQTITLGSTATGIAQYNTVDQTTNWQRTTLAFLGGKYAISAQANGTAVAPDLGLSSGLRSLSVSSTGTNSTLFEIASGATGAGNIFSFTNAVNFSGTGVQNLLSLYPTITQSGAGSYRVIYASPWDATSTGSGFKYLIDVGTNSASNNTGTHSSKFNVNTAGDGLFVGSVFVGGRLSVGSSSIPAAFLDINGTSFATSNAFGTGGIGISQRAATYNSTSAAGSPVNVFINSFASATLTASNAQSITNLYGNFFNAATPSTNVSVTNNYAAGFGGSIGISGNIIPATTGTTNIGSNSTLLNNIYTGQVYAVNFRPAAGSVITFGNVAASTTYAQWYLNTTGNLILQNGGTYTDNAINRLQVGGNIKATQYRLSALNTAPSSSTDTGTTGEIRFTSGFLYLCTATNTWVRSAFSTF